MKLQTTQKDGKLYGKLPDTGWINIQFSSNDWEARPNYQPAFRKVGNIVFLKGQLLPKKSLNAGNYNISMTNLPTPSVQHTFSSISYNGTLLNFWLVNQVLTLRLFSSNYSDPVGVSIDSSYIAN